MNFLQRNAKRILTDAAGYGLIILGIALGWLPGPGGIPLIIAGLGLLSINNVWAERLRDYLLARGGKIVKVLFPKNTLVTILYDVITLALFALVAFLAIKHSAIWQISLAVGLFFIALFIASLNRDRLEKLRHRSKHK